MSAHIHDTDTTDLTIGPPPTQNFAVSSLINLGEDLFTKTKTKTKIKLKINLRNYNY